jgi:hypothetical protein
MQESRRLLTNSLILSPATFRHDSAAAMVEHDYATAMWGPSVGAYWPIGSPQLWMKFVLVRRARPILPARTTTCSVAARKEKIDLTSGVHTRVRRGSGLRAGGNWPAGPTGGDTTVAAEQGGGTTGGGLARRVWWWAEQRALGLGSIFFFFLYHFLFSILNLQVSNWNQSWGFNIKYVQSKVLQHEYKVYFI